jgi:hypothetical protein
VSNPSAVVISIRCEIRGREAECQAPFCGDRVDEVSSFNAEFCGVGQILWRDILRKDTCSELPLEEEKRVCTSPIEVFV